MHYKFWLVYICILVHHLFRTISLHSEQRIIKQQGDVAKSRNCTDFQQETLVEICTTVLLILFAENVQYFSANTFLPRRTRFISKLSCSKERAFSCAFFSILSCFYWNHVHQAVLSIWGIRSPPVSENIFSPKGNCHPRFSDWKLKNNWIRMQYLGSISLIVVCRKNVTLEAVGLIYGTVVHKHSN